MMNEQIEDINQRIADRVLALRLSKKVPPLRIADAIGSKLNRVTRLERGRSTLTAAELVLVAQVLGVKTSQLVGEEPVDGGAS